jgi:hypothetical protein
MDCLKKATVDETNRERQHAGPGKHAEPSTPLGLRQDEASVMRLQRLAGNQAVAGWVQRAPAAGLTKAAEAAEQEQKQNTVRPPAMQVSNVADVSAARELVNKLESWRPLLQEGSEASGAFVTSPNRVTPPKMDANEVAISSLDDYLVTAGEQSRTLGSFQGALQQARVNFARLKAQVSLLTSTKAISGEQEGMGKEIVHGAGLGDQGAAQQGMQKLEVNPAMLGVHNQVQDAHDQMQSLGKKVGTEQNAVSMAVYAYQAALNNFKSGLPHVETNPEQAAALNELKEKIETVKKYVSKGLELAGKGLEKAGVPGAGMVGEHAGVAVDFLTDQFYAAELNGIQTKIAQYNGAHREHPITAGLDTVREKSRAFTGAVTEYNSAVEEFGHAQTTFRDKLRSLGRAADAGHGDHYAQIAAVLAEVDTFETQLDDALRLAYQEQTAANEATATRRTLEGGRKEGGGRDAPMPYYSPYRWFHNNGGWSYECQPNELHLGTYGARGSTEGDVNVAVNPTIEKGIDDLKWSREQVDPMRQALAQALDLKMEGGAPTAPGGTGTTSRSEKTGL